MTFVANEMAKRFIVEKNKTYGLNKIIYDLNYLVYSETKEPLTYEDKSAIITHIFNIIAGREKLKLKEDEQIEPNFRDIAIFFERRDFIKTQLTTGVNKQAELN